MNTPLLLIQALTGTADASTLVRLGDLLFMDPLTFDAGLLQHSADVSGGAGTDLGLLETAGEAPFFQELSVRVAHNHDFAYGPAPLGRDGDRIAWRLRFPVIQSLRYGRVNTWAFQYRGEAHIRAVDPMSPRHDVDLAFSWGRGARGRNHTHHLQLGVVVRDHQQAGHAGARAGAVLRYAAAVELGGGVGPVAPAIAPLELVVHHYGLVDRRDGRIDVGVLAPQVFWNTGRVTWRAGITPRARVGYPATGPLSIDWGGLAVVSSSWVPKIE